MTAHAEFYVNLTKGAYRQIGEIYAKIFLAIAYIYLFQKLTYRSDPLADF